jgi:hypothetical protein
MPFKAWNKIKNHQLPSSVATPFRAWNKRKNPIWLQPKLIIYDYIFD